MLKIYLAELAQNPKVGMVIGGTISGSGAAVKWLDVAKDWLSTSAMVVGLALSLVALVAQIIRAKNDIKAERRAEEMHREQMKKFRATD